MQKKSEEKDVKTDLQPKSCGIFLHQVFDKTVWYEIVRINFKAMC